MYIRAGLTEVEEAGVGGRSWSFEAATRTVWPQEVTKQIGAWRGWPHTEGVKEV